MCEDERLMMKTSVRSRPLAFILLGPPGVGKGGLRRHLVTRGFTEIESSAVIREVSELNPHIGDQVRNKPASALLGDTVMNVILDEKLDTIRTRPNMVFDGFPRTIRQAEHLCDRLMSRRYRFRFVFLNAPDEVCQVRACVYRKHEGRHDDVPHIHQERMKIWHNNYRDLRRGLEEVASEDIFEVDATPPLEVVIARVAHLAV